ncbi:MAG: threonine/serine exporter family protein [Chthoniobacterales bacterium]
MPVSSAPLDHVARLALTIGRMLLEWGANARTVHMAIVDAARGFGCDSTEVYCQHAAVIVMLRRGGESCAQMGKVGEHGVNLRCAETLMGLVDRIAAGHLDCDSALAEVESVPLKSGAYPAWFVCVTTGLACAAFGRLLDADWSSFLPILAGAACGQWLRRALLHRKQNIFFIVSLVAFVSALIAGLGGRLVGSGHLDIATTAAVLLLVPGPAVLNALWDAIDGKPNLAAARALRVILILLFMTFGLLAAQQLTHV